jgi:hypothetical protein
VRVHVIEAGNDEATVAFDESSAPRHSHRAATRDLDNLPVSNDHRAITHQLSGADVDDDHVVEYKACANGFRVRVVGAADDQRDQQTQRCYVRWSQV